MCWRYTVRLVQTSKLDVCLTLLSWAPAWCQLIKTDEAVGSSEDEGPMSGAAPAHINPQQDGGLPRGVMAHLIELLLDEPKRTA